jgi:glucosinolate gamma-glutamyl hydrolase
MASSSVPYRFAILQNYVNNARPGPTISDSLADLIHHSYPDAAVSVFRPIEGEAFPDLASYDLVIFTGGRFDLLDPNPKPAWVEDTLAYVRKSAADSSAPKLLGICWGHQAISYALGGKLEPRKSGPCVSRHLLNQPLPFTNQPWP